MNNKKELVKEELIKNFNNRFNTLNNKIKLNKENADKYLKDALEYIDNNHNFIENDKTNEYAKDTRSIAQMYASIMINGWLIEDYIISNLNWYKLFELKLDGADKNRKFGTYVKADPDMKIRNSHIELQTINNLKNEIFLKENKLNKCIKLNSLVLFYNINENNYLILDKKDLLIIKANKQLETIYDTKKGYVLNSNEFKSYTETEIINILKYC